MSNNKIKAITVVNISAILGLLCGNVALGCEQLSFDKPWVREPPPVSRVAAGYVTIKNRGTTNLSITSIESNCCNHLMFHQTTMEDNNARMSHLAELSITAGSHAILEPLGTHIMLMGPESSLRKGAFINITFTCGEDDKTNVSFPILKQ